MVVQNISSDGKETDLTFTIKSEDVNRSLKIIKENKKISYRKLSLNTNLSKIIIAWYDNNKRRLPWRVGKNSSKKLYYFPFE